MARMTCECGEILSDFSAPSDIQLRACMDKEWGAIYVSHKVPKVDRMQLSGNRFGSNNCQAGGDYGRGVAPQFIEDVISSAKPKLRKQQRKLKLKR